MDTSIPQNLDQCTFNFEALNTQPFEQTTFDTSHVIETSSEKKKCSSCKEIKPKDHEHFGKEARSKDGFRKDCKECRKKQRLEALKRNPDMEKEAWQKKKDNPYYKDKSTETYAQMKTKNAKYMREWREENVSKG